MLGPLRSTMRAIFGRGRWEGDLDEELRSHVEHRAADLIRAGQPPRDAERQARLELGSGETYREECRRSYGLRWFIDPGGHNNFAALTASLNYILSATVTTSLSYAFYDLNSTQAGQTEYQDIIILSITKTF